MVRIAESIVRGAAEQNLVKDFGEQEQAMDAIRDYAGIAEGFKMPTKAGSTFATKCSCSP